MKTGRIFSLCLWLAVCSALPAGCGNAASCAGVLRFSGMGLNNSIGALLSCTKHGMLDNYLGL